MKTTTKVSDITHEDIVALIATALEGSYVFDISYDCNEYRKLPNPNDSPTYEDRCAKLLLNGKSLTIGDTTAYDEEDFHGGNLHSWDVLYGVMEYTVDLECLRRGFQICLDGKETWDEDTKSYLRECMQHLMEDDAIQLDQPEAESILQVVVFEDYIYA